MREKVLDGAFKVFKKKGLKFTMDDLASELAMSKKTIYTIFPDKATLLYEMVEVTFDRIKESEDVIYNDDSLSTLDKIKGVLAAMPDMYSDFDFTEVYAFKGKYPEVYSRVTERIENGWEKTRSLLNLGVEEGTVRQINFDLFQMAYEAAVERFIMSDDLAKRKIPYTDALNILVDIMVSGIVIK